MPEEELLQFEDTDAAPADVEFEDLDAPGKAKPVVAARKPVMEFDQVIVHHVPVAEPEPAPAPEPEPAAWEPRTDEGLQEIQSGVDALGGGRTLDYEEIARRVDKLTRKVKDRDVVVQETYTDYVEVPAESQPEAAEVPAPKSQKRKPRLLGFFGSRKTKAKVDAAVAERAASQPDKHYQPQCSALTEDGQQCRNSARGESKYCASHKGYQPPTAKGIAKRVEGEAWDPSDKRTDASSVRGADTRPSVRKAKDTKLAVRKSAKRPAKAAKKGGRKKR